MLIIDKVIHSTENYDLAVGVDNTSDYPEATVYLLLNRDTGVVEWQDTLYARIHPMLKTVQDYWDKNQEIKKENNVRALFHDNV